MKKGNAKLRRPASSIFDMAQRMGEFRKLPESAAKKVQRVLSLDPISAGRIAAKTGLPVESVYAELVKLYDEGGARMTRRPGQTQHVQGWVVA